MQEWLDLYDSLDIEYLSPEVWTEEQFKDFEREQNLIVPQSYKEYCRIFGSGTFGQYMAITCPAPPALELGHSLLDGIREEIECFYSSELERCMSIDDIQALLDSAFVFGGDYNLNIVFWDLRTYDSDRSYDIYWAARYFDGHILKVGRGFYEFIKNFCLGSRSLELLPEYHQPDPERIYNKFFHAI
jgi:hypothetical protein